MQTRAFYSSPLLISFSLYFFVHHWFLPPLIYPEVTVTSDCIKLICALIEGETQSLTSDLTKSFSFQMLLLLLLNFLLSAYNWRDKKWETHKMKRGDTKNVSLITIQWMKWVTWRRNARFLSSHFLSRFFHSFQSWLFPSFEHFNCLSLFQFLLFSTFSLLRF